MIGVPAYRFRKPAGASPSSRPRALAGAVVDLREPPHAPSSTAGDDRTLARRITHGSAPAIGRSWTPLASADPGRTLIDMEARDQVTRPPGRPPVAGGDH